MPKRGGRISARSGSGKANEYDRVDIPGNEKKRRAGSETFVFLLIDHPDDLLLHGAEAFEGLEQVVVRAEVMA